MFTNATDSFNQTGLPVEKHRIPKHIFDRLDGLHKLAAEILIDKGDWVLI